MSVKLNLNSNNSQTVGENPTSRKRKFSSTQEDEQLIDGARNLFYLTQKNELEGAFNLLFLASSEDQMNNNNNTNSDVPPIRIPRKKILNYLISHVDKEQLGIKVKEGRGELNPDHFACFVRNESNESTINKTSITNIEKGEIPKRQMTPAVLKAIAKTINMPIIRFLTKSS
ncbi:MAG: hypothetical protein V4487_01470 [Chlamydiota bacterium]